METPRGPYADAWFNKRQWHTIVFAAYIAYMTSLFIPFTGIMNKVKQHKMDSCVKITGEDQFNSCEDFFLSEEGVGYLACDPLKLDPAATEGAIWRVDYNQSPAIVEKFTMVDIVNFHPLGIRIDTHPETREKTVVVVNIPENNDPSVEVFNIDEENLKLVRKRSIKHPKIYTPNSLHVVSNVQFRAADGTPSFFFTNSHYFTNDILKAIETIFVSWSNIGFYNARLDSVENGVNGLRFANGLSGSEKNLLVAETYMRDIKLYEITTSVDSLNMPHIHLHFVKEAKFNMAVDNVVYYPDRHVAIVAGHPKPFNVGRYIATKDTSIQAGTQVDVWNLNTDETKMLVQDDGSFYRGSTTGAIDFKNTKLIISSILDKGILVCDLT